MKVIFTQDVTGVARRKEVQDVADGYALNFLLPNGLAVRATPAALQALTQKQLSEARLQQQALDTARKLEDQLKNKLVTIVRPAARTGTLYSAIASAVVAQAIHEQLGVKLSPSQIIVPSHAKSIGEHQVQINLHPNVKVTIMLHVTAT